MRRKDREVVKREDIEKILINTKVMRIAILDNDNPYVVPLNFGYTWEENEMEICFHSAKEGRKIDILKVNPNIGFEMDCGHALIEGQVACQYGYQYESLIGCGTAYIVEEMEEKKKLLQILMKHQTGQEFQFSNEQTERVTVVKIKVKEFSAKRHSL